MKDKQTCILVLGMHRSGTSAIGGILNLLNISMGKELMGATMDNQKGYFENENIFKFHDMELFPFLKTEWDDLNYLVDDWHNSEKLDSFYIKARNIILDDYHRDKIFAIKDPRISLLFPFWEKVLSDMGIEIKIIIAIRNPIEIASSLFKRDDFSINKSLTLWSKHTLYAEYYTRKYMRVFLYYNELLANTSESISKIVKQLQLNQFIDLNKNSLELETFVEKGLKHNQSDESLKKYVPTFIKNTLQNINNLSNNIDKTKSIKKLNNALSMYKQYANFMIDSTQKNKLLLLYNNLEKNYNHQKNIIQDSDNIQIYKKIDFNNLFEAVLYIDTGNGFNHKETIKTPYKLNSLTFEYDLSTYSNIKNIRFDVLHYACSLSLKYFLIDNRIINDIKHNGIYYNKKIFFLHNDPQLIVTNNFNNINIIKISIKKLNILEDIFSLRLKFLDKKIDLKNLEISKNQKEIQAKSDEIDKKDLEILENQKEIQAKSDEIDKKDLEILENQKEIQAKSDEIDKKNLKILENQKELQAKSDEINKKDLEILKNQKELQNLISSIEEQNRIRELEKIKLNQKEIEILALKELAQSMRIKNRVKRVINIKSLFIKKNEKSKNEKSS